MSHKTDLANALARYDEADASKRVTSGEDLTYWEEEFADAKDEIAEIIADLGPIECARVIVAQVSA